MLRKVALIAAGVLLLGIGSPRADEAVLDQIYGNGVHAYFGGDFSRAYDSLSSAIRGGSRDPRAYYFRALAESRLGRQPDAAADFEKGAALEAADVNGHYSVSQALERVQGPARAALEQYRENARAVAFERELRQRQNVFGQQKSNEAVLLRREIPPAELTPTPTPDGVVAKQPGVDANGPAAPKTAAAKPDEAVPNKTASDKPVEAVDPFGGDAKPAEKPAEKPAAKGAEKPAEKSTDADPFGSDAKPAEKPAEKPAGAAIDKKIDAAAAADTPATDVKPQPGAVRGIFKALSGALPGGDSGAPGAASAPKSPPVATPAASPPAAAGADDPFGAAPAAPAKPAAATPPAGAKKADNPFGDEPSPPKAAPDTKAPADKSPPEMKKSDDPFKI